MIVCFRLRILSVWSFWFFFYFIARISANRNGQFGVFFLLSSNETQCSNLNSPIWLHKRNAMKMKRKNVFAKIKSDLSSYHYVIAKWFSRLLLYIFFSLLFVFIWWWFRANCIHFPLDRFVVCMELVRAYFGLNPIFRIHLNRMKKIGKFSFYWPLGHKWRFESHSLSLSYAHNGIQCLFYYSTLVLCFSFSTSKLITSIID